MHPSATTGTAVRAVSRAPGCRSLREAGLAAGWRVEARWSFVVSVEREARVRAERVCRVEEAKRVVWVH